MSRMRGPLSYVTLCSCLVALLGAGACSAEAATRCAHRGERVVASNAWLVMLAPPAHPATSTTVRTVCERRTGKRQTLVSINLDLHAVARIEREALRGRFSGLDEQRNEKCR